MKQQHAQSKIVGSVSLWRYTENQRNYPGWHLSADTRAVNSLSVALSELQVSGGHRTVTIEAPTESILSVPNNKSGKAAWLSPSKWRIQYAGPAEQPSFWRFPLEADTAVLSLGRESLQVLIAGIQGLSQGKGDYTIGHSGPAEEVMWFWWRRK